MAGPVNKCEVHVLGGECMADILYVEPWGEAADSLMDIAGRAVAERTCVRISNPCVINAAPARSTSRLHYYLKAIGPIGTAGTQ